MRQLDAPMNEGALRPDSGEQHGEERPQNDIAAAPECGLHIASGRTHDDSKRDANQERLIRFFS